MTRPFAELASVALAMLLLTGVLSAAQASDDNTPVGYWKTIDDHTGQARSIVQIFEANGELHGRVEKFLNLPNGTKPPTCDKCPGDKKGKPVLGLEFLWGFKRDGAGWSDGSVLDPEEGRVYHANLELLDGGKRLKLFGYVRVVFKIGRSQTWLRVASPD
ncbi:MAG TPA: DUF2147 domain-containing protein [Polyangiaceae bacterium]|jgi:uncharacterized protein (DUF2147 family)|nr:DUF2147 domain-containing protein [Polyangiaceae bacterium]